MKQGNHIVLYKRVGNPVIPVFVEGDDVVAKITLEDFIAKLKEEIEGGGQIWTTITHSQLGKKIDDAAARVIYNMKLGISTLMDE